MAPRVYPSENDYFLTKPEPTEIRCKAYADPPSVGNKSGYILTIDPGTYLGPVEEVEHTHRFVTIRVKGYWINVWTSERGGNHFAKAVNKDTVEQWIRRGWKVM